MRNQAVLKMTASVFKAAAKRLSSSPRSFVKVELIQGSTLNCVARLTLLCPSVTITRNS
jgi:hypothetical protein